jgi:hypothetical protein
MCRWLGRRTVFDKRSSYVDTARAFGECFPEPKNKTDDLLLCVSVRPTIATLLNWSHRYGSALQVNFAATIS